MSSELSTSVLLCTRNPGHKELTATLQALGRQVVPADEIIIVDQSQNSLVPSVVSQTSIPLERLVFLHTPKESGVSRARNTAVRRATEDILIWIDDDIVTRDTHVGRIREFFEQNPNLSALLAPVLPDRDLLLHTPTPSHIPYFDPKKEIYPMHYTDSYGMGGNFAIRREVARRYPYDELLGPGGLIPAAEDWDQMYRLLRDKLLVATVVDDDVTVLHSGIRVGRRTIRRWAHEAEYGTGATIGKYLHMGDTGAAILLMRRFGDIALHVTKSILQDDHKPHGARRAFALSKGVVEGIRTPVDAQRRVFSNESITS